MLPDSAKPDIYFLVFDEYTNNKTLKKVWQYDNRSLTNWLDSSHFFIPADTRANYTFTPYSISSTFNMNYIEDKPKSVDATIPINILQSVKSMSDNECFSLLEKENYIIRFISPFKNRIEESGLGHYFEDLSNEQIYRQTLPGSIDADILWNFRIGKNPLLNDSTERRRLLEEKYRLVESTIRQVNATTDSLTTRRPHFVYGHFLITHGPHIFDSAGGFMPDQHHENLPMGKTYISQIIYANKVIREIVGSILLNNKRNTIIIVEGDHGFRQFEGRDSSMYFPNFCAVYFPDRNYSLLYNNMSPINIFRIIFNQYFYQRFPLLKDSSILVKENKS